MSNTTPTQKPKRQRLTVTTYHENAPSEAAIVRAAMVIHRDLMAEQARQAAERGAEEAAA